MKKIAVLMGGCSNERDISIQSGENVVAALSSLKRFEVIPVVLNNNSLDELPENIDAAFIALHGGWGENGGVQMALDSRKIPYTGPGANASRIAMDKIKTKMILEMNNISTASWSLASKDTPESPLPLPVVIKPPCDGSSVGISKVADKSQWADALECALKAQDHKGNVLVEEFIPGREFSVPIIDGRVIRPVEIIAENGWYGYEEKYTSTSTKYSFVDENEKILNTNLYQCLCDISLKAYKALSCRSIARVDIRVSPIGRAYVLELNTSPGLTSHSLVPMSAKKCGLEFPELCEQILETASYGDDWRNHE
jgi:D-alanine-D-alanine ligase